VQQTTDTELLNKIYTTLAGTGLQEKLRKALSSDGDAARHMDRIVQTILETDGTYEEKNNFIKGYPDGYIDIDLLLSGKSVSFEKLINSKIKGAPVEFARRVFKNLETIKGQKEKGPGEFALAVLSPKLDIWGAGDVKVNDKVIEVKAAGGRLGSTGFLSHDKVPQIIQGYMEITPGQSLGLTEFQRKSLTDLNEKQRKALGTELFGYIFKKYPYVDTSELIQKFTKGEPIHNEYILASYRAYVGPQGKEKFHGLLLMNFEQGRLKYYEDPKSILDDITGPAVQLIASNQQFAPRNIIPALTLKKRGANLDDADSDAPVPAGKPLTKVPPLKPQARPLGQGNKVPMGTNPVKSPIKR
jgi:hypothetical protein